MIYLKRFLQSEFVAVFMCGVVTAIVVLLCVGALQAQTHMV